MKPRRPSEYNALAEAVRKARRPRLQRVSEEEVAEILRRQEVAEILRRQAAAAKEETTRIWLEKQKLEQEEPAEKEKHDVS